MTEGLKQRMSSAASPASTARTQSHKIKDKWKLSEVLFAFSLPQQGREGGNDIACSRTTQDLLRQKNRDLYQLSAHSQAASSYWCLFLFLHKCCCSTFSAGVSRRPLSKKKCTSQTRGVGWMETRSSAHAGSKTGGMQGVQLRFGLFSGLIFGSSLTRSLDLLNSVVWQRNWQQDNLEWCPFYLLTGIGSAQRCVTYLPLAVGGFDPLL